MTQLRTETKNLERKKIPKSLMVRFGCVTSFSNSDEINIKT